MKLSVCMITYNHEKFIAQAIESVLMQEADFEYELVISEDCSTDSTRAIVEDYHKRYPERIRLLPSDENLGMMKNSVRALQACQGEYIAFLEGDDYWTAPRKLQAQVDYLDTHPECAVSWHRVMRVYEDGSCEPAVCPSDPHKDVSSLEDLLDTNFLPAGSVVFRNGLLGALPDWYLRLPVGDWPLYLLLAMHGDIGLVDGTMSVYRVHSGGVWSLTATRERRCLVDLEIYGRFSRILGRAHAPTIRRCMAKRYRLLVAEYENRGARRQAARCALRLLLLDPRESSHWEPPGIAALRLCCPTLHKAGRACKHALNAIRHGVEG